MSSRYLIVTFLLTLPSLTSAQSSLQNVLENTLNFLGGIILPSLMAIGFLFVVFNVARYFVLQGGSEEGQKAARSLLIYSIATFVLIVIFWGLINVLANSLGFNRITQPCPDYLREAGSCDDGIPPFCNPGHPSYPGCLNY